MSLLLALAFWLFCGVIAAVIAEARRRSVIAWALLGFIFGPFAIILVAVLPTVTPTEHELLRTGNLKKCPDCAELVKAEANKCRYCGAPLRQPAPEPTITEKLAEHIARLKQ